MSKPLGYYTGYTPGDDTLLAKLQDKYGAAFEKITKREKLVILTVLASHLGCALEGDCRAEIFTVAKQITEEITLADQAGIMFAGVKILSSRQENRLWDNCLIVYFQRITRNNTSVGWQNSCWCFFTHTKN